MNAPPPLTRGEVCFFHRRDASPGVRRGVVLASGADGIRVKDTEDGTNHEVLHEGVYSHATVHAGDLREAVVALTMMGIPVHLTDAQRTALED